jgi:hypothetical protein
MGIFDDKKFDQLDWMTQVTETIESKLNELLAKLPDKVELSYDDVVYFMEAGYSTYLPRDVIVRKILREFPEFRLSWEDEQTIKNCFELEMSDSFIIDMENKRLEGSVSLVKRTHTLSCEQLQASMGQEGLNYLNRISWCAEGALARANEVLELLGGCDDSIKNRSSRKKRKAIHSRLTKIFTENEWRVRDTELANKIGKWVYLYVSEGNLAAFSNFCKVKVMTHQGGPIYSIEEQE